MPASARTSACTRTAGCWPPPTKTCPTPLICEIFCARMLLPASNTCASGRVSERRSRIRIGESAGFTLRKLGRVGRFDGSSPPAALIAAWTSRAAAVTSRSRSNCIVIVVEPSALAEVISVSPAMRPKRRSSGVATAEAIVAGLAPGSDAETEIVGKSICGSGDTGS